jgi:hypothetical protein
MVFSPKIQAAVEFVEQGGERAVVCRPWTFVRDIPVTVGGYREVCRGRVGYVAGGGFWWVERLNAEDN